MKLYGWTDFIRPIPLSRCGSGCRLDLETLPDGGYPKTLVGGDELGLKALLFRTCPASVPYRAAYLAEQESKFWPKLLSFGSEIDGY